MTYILRCDTTPAHDIERGERYLQLFLTNQSGMPFATKVFCAEHARMDTEDVMYGILNGKWAEVKAQWQEA